MADEMDVDTSPSVPPLPHLPPGATDPVLLLRHALQQFIRTHLARALGPDMVSVFAPSPNASVTSLLHFIDKKWLGVFADSALDPHRHKLKRLATMLQSSDDSESARRREDAIAADLLHVVGRPSLAARIPSAPSSHDDSPSIPAALHLASGGTPASGHLIPVVLDGSNVAWNHGRNARFSIRGAAEALHYFSSRGHPTVLFLPEARLARCERDDERPIFDAVSALAGGDCLVQTPENDYDDSYICHFARKHGAIVVSNDAFKDQVYQARAEGMEPAKEWEKWFRACRLSFTFRSDLFIPNPSFNYQKAAAAATELALKD